MENLKEILEALIFISVEPLTVEKMKEVLTEVPETDIAQTIQALVTTYETSGGAIRIIQTAGGYVFSTKPEHDPYVRRLLQIERKKKLSGQALETLSAVAYHQPVTQAEISAIRSVDSTYSLHTLLENKLIKIVGRKEAPGRPLLYRTTEKFLAYFGLNAVEDLPSEEELKKLMQEENA
ncbi:MAG: SMC-Scp complex subunit ScpB [Candidatus Aminicenantales bacterium]